MKCATRAIGTDGLTTDRSPDGLRLSREAIPTHYPTGARDREA